MNELYYKYWGKARKNPNVAGGWDYHLLPYHCLDVAAVGRVWIEDDTALRRRLISATGKTDEVKLFAWLAFCFTLHDFGKFDIRFQLKIVEILQMLWTALESRDTECLSTADIVNYRHDNGGYGAFCRFKSDLIGLGPDDENEFDTWQPWLATVMGHHGILPSQVDWPSPFVENNIKHHDRQARSEWVKDVAAVFSLADFPTEVPPHCDVSIQPLIAGFCSVTDWIASNEEFVIWERKPLPLNAYFIKAQERCRSLDMLHRCGVVGRNVVSYAGVKSFLGQNESRQIQTIVDDLPPESGLVIVEGPTGSGKTEAALTLAWRVIASGNADAIVFALPTQATANAMLDRLELLSPIIFGESSPNLVLAHGKAGYNRTFANLKTAVTTGQPDDGSVQCARWIASSRKRVFLGQVGVCTIDQVLLSVLPVRHNYVRAFGVMKSVLIVDEVHAYDRYMYGLLEEVLKRQHAAGGTVILLSATLPAVQKTRLIKAWDTAQTVTVPQDAPYPLLTYAGNNGATKSLTVARKDRPPEKDVAIDLLTQPGMEPDDECLRRIVDAAMAGATVGVVCNLVKSAQDVTRKLQELTTLTVDIFHGRYRFKDRQIRERTALQVYGKDGLRDVGRILVATQVIEQSVDLDFDWMVTQLCPIDLLFQRMGRLHRHERKRPVGFTEPKCTVLTSGGVEFGAHEAVYADVRVLWRTREELRRNSKPIRFPDAYRVWIEKVYDKEFWEDEPESIIGKSLAFAQEQKDLWAKAKELTNGGINPFDDTNQNALSLTRGKAMGINVIPVRVDLGDKFTLEGDDLKRVSLYELDEQLDMNAVSVPASWQRWLPSFEDGYIFLPMRKDGDGWRWSEGTQELRYTNDFGLEKQKRGDD